RYSHSAAKSSCSDLAVPDSFSFCAFPMPNPISSASTKVQTRIEPPFTAKTYNRKRTQVKIFSGIRKSVSRWQSIPHAPNGANPVHSGDRPRFTECRVLDQAGETFWAGMAAEQKESGDL